MSLFLTLLPVYVMGNLHCMGMCGPLVMMLGRHRFRYFYFLGRLLSFGLAGLAAGSAGAVVHLVLKHYNASAIASFLFGAILFYIGFQSLTKKPLPNFKWLNQANQTLSLLLLKDQPFATFLFGFFTVALPCGQTLLVFSACALAGDGWVGLFNGLAFALLTSPSLFFAMHAHALFGQAKQYYHQIVGVSGIGIGLLAFCRGLADMDVIPHLILSAKYHIVLY